MDFNSYAYSKNSALSLYDFFCKNFSTPPVLLCIGTDRILADCLGPLIADQLRAINYPQFIYGGLSAPITRQNAIFASQYIRTMHPESKLLVIDSMASTTSARLGHIIINNRYNGALQNLDIKADLYLYGITSILHQQKLFNARLFNIKNISNSIVSAFVYYVKNRQKNNQKILKK